MGLKDICHNDENYDYNKAQQSADCFIAWPFSKALTFALCDSENDHKERKFVKGNFVHIHITNPTFEKLKNVTGFAHPNNMIAGLVHPDIVFAVRIANSRFYFIVMTKPHDALTDEAKDTVDPDYTLYAALHIRMLLSYIPTETYKYLPYISWNTIIGYLLTNPDDHSNLLHNEHLEIIRALQETIMHHRFFNKYPSDEGWVPDSDPYEGEIVVAEFPDHEMNSYYQYFHANRYQFKDLAKIITDDADDAQKERLVIEVALQYRKKKKKKKNKIVFYDLHCLRLFVKNNIMVESLY